MAQFSLADLPPTLLEHVPKQARLTYPPQGMTSDVAFAEHAGTVVVVKRCAHKVYLDWLRREQIVLRALAGVGLPIPQFIAYAESDAGGARVGWLLTSRIAASPLFGAAIDASASRRETLFRRLGELMRQLHSTPVPSQLLQGGTWFSRQLAQARENLPWCDGTAADLAELLRSQPAAWPEALIHGDMALDNVLVDEQGALHLIDWAGGGSGDPRHDIALALDTMPELELSAVVLDAFYAGYGIAALDAETRDWFVRLYNHF